VTYPDNTSEPINLRVLPLPMSGGEVEYIPQSGVGLAAFRTTDQKAEAAAEFIRWFTEAERNLDFVVQTGYMPVCIDAYGKISSYEFESDAYASLYAAIETMNKKYTAVSRPDFSGFYAMTDQLYAGLREMQGTLKDRAAAGEDVLSLAEETWEFFKTIH